MLSVLITMPLRGHQLDRVRRVSPGRRVARDEKGDEF